VTEARSEPSREEVVSLFRSLVTAPETVNASGNVLYLDPAASDELFVPPTFGRAAEPQG
jgi:hypothetical protein